MKNKGADNLYTPRSDVGRLVVVSNRLPMTLSKERRGWKSEKSTGGLATAMDPLLERTGGIWIGWSGDSSVKRDAEREAELDRWRMEENCIAVDLPPEVVKGYYEGFSNATLWFLFHSFPEIVKFNTSDWRDYVKANETFRDAVVKELQPDDLIWIHDYQLMLLPQMIREAVPASAAAPHSTVNAGCTDRLLFAYPVPVIRRVPRTSAARGGAEGAFRRRLSFVPYPSISPEFSVFSAPDQRYSKFNGPHQPWQQADKA